MTFVSKIRYKSGSAPKLTMLHQIADYFHIRVEQLTEEDYKLSNIDLIEQLAYDFDSDQWHKLIDYAFLLKFAKKE